MIHKEYTSSFFISSQLSVKETFRRCKQHSRNRASLVMIILVRIKKGFSPVTVAHRIFTDLETLRISAPSL